MKWNAEWWGIEMLAETEQDEELLRELCEILPQSAKRSYAEGKWRLYRGGRGKLRLEFRR